MNAALVLPAAPVRPAPSGTLLRFPSALPDMPESAPLPPGTTVASLTATLQRTAEALCALLQVGKRLGQAASREGCRLGADENVRAAASVWFEAHALPIIRSGWRNSPWERRFFDLTYALDIVSDHVCDYAPVADLARRVAALHDAAGNELEGTLDAFVTGAAHRHEHVAVAALVRP